MATKHRLPLLIAVAAGILTGTAEAQVRAVYDQGSNALARQLQRLQTTASVMHTGAHPDDEDSALVAYHARQEHARTAYLSLTRGSGGQNIIGTEQADLLGVIRTEELLQARRLDGAAQLFTRANDFGFSKYRAEAQRLWDEDAVLGDMVRAIRRFRPTVVVSRWSGTPADGHGHHQFAGYLTPLALDAAADPVRFPGQIADGLSPWQVDKFYVMRRIDPKSVSSPALLVNTGEYDPVTGRSYFEIGMQGRSQQKTQQMGSLELRGRQLSGLELVDSQVDAAQSETSIFDGVDVSISGIATFEQDTSVGFSRLLTELESAAAGALALFDPFEPAALIPTLAGGLRMARAARDSANSADALRLLDEKIGEFESALALAAGISIDALAATETIVPGGTLQVAVRLFQAGGSALIVDRVVLAAPPGWAVSATAAGELANERNYRRRENADAQVFFDVTVPAAAKPTQPYWLQAPRREFSYDWSQAGDARNQAFAKPLITAIATLAIGGESITLAREVQYRYVDRVRGEIRRRLDVVPAVSVEAATSLLIVPASAELRRHDALLTLRNNSSRDVKGAARFTAPAGWRIDPASAEFALAPGPASTTLAFSATLPESVAAGEYHLQAIATVDDVEYRHALREISYPHIQTHRVYEDSTMEVEVIDVSVAPVVVGYVMGSGDKVPDALRRLGLQVTLLDDAALTTGDLSRFDTIVIGIRASQTRPAYVANNQRLLDFVATGGTMIVQYQQPDFISQGLAPFPASMDGNVRVVDETAPVIILEPGHPVFNFPNRIDAQDFDGWIQERNNYNFTSFDRDRYLPLTESHDEGEADSSGGMLYARIGEGHYVYTAYSWFRQLPNGVPGAYRIFANLLSLPDSPQ